MITHRVKQGECLLSIAQRYGFADWKRIYDDPANEALRQTRASPYTLLPGDVVAIPDPEQKSVDCACGQRHCFTLDTPTARLRVKVCLWNGDVAANKRYVLEFDDTSVEGTTGADGLVEHEVPARLEAARLRVFLDVPGAAPEGLLIPVHIGHLDPIETLSGVQGRLANLGYHCPVDGAMDELTTAALRQFQSRKGLPVTGELDDATRSRLREAHNNV